MKEVFSRLSQMVDNEKLDDDNSREYDDPYMKDEEINFLFQDVE
jgi:hypothetical protein